MSRVLLVGESNPYGADPRFALYPEPPGCAGARLCAILGMTDREYLRTFDRANLCTLVFSLRSARFAAHRLTAEYRVLLGARVTAAHGLDFVSFTVNQCAGCYSCQYQGHPHPWRAALILPHPSGRSRFWNAPGAAERARRLVCDLVALARSARG